MLHGRSFFVKVNLDNNGEKLPGSTYGLFKPGENNALVKVAEATTDDEGVLEFDGVLTDVEYTVQELVAPDGFYVSENPISISFKVDEDNNVVIDKFDDGSGTATVDENGNITWLEPEVKVSFTKQDMEGHNLAGASLKVVDEDGKDVISWTSTTEPYVVNGTFIAGKTYKLVEVAAPDGYKLADPISFTVNEKAGAKGEETICR